MRTEPDVDPSDSIFQEQLDRRMREAEALVKQTIERVRLDEEKRLTEWTSARRDEEERRLARWADERRASVEHSLDQRSTGDRRSVGDRRSTTSETLAPRVDRRASGDDVVQRIERMLLDWQERFDQRLDQRRDDDARVAERLRIADEERLRAWRYELERTLTQRSLAGERAVTHARVEESPLAHAIASATSARDVGRVLHEALATMSRTSAFVLALHKDGREDVAYRYRVGTDDAVGSLLRREAVDDGPQSAAAHAEGWLRAHRVVRAGTRNANIHTAQLAVRVGDGIVGVFTLQTEDRPIADNVLARIAELAQLAGPRLAELRDAGSLRGA